MPIFSKPNAIVYVRRSGLIVAGKKLTPARLNFDSKDIQNLEVLQADAFIEKLTKFFSEHNLKGKHVLMVLDDSVVFSKQVDLDADGQLSLIADAFIEAIPLDVGKRACVRVRTKTDFSLYATNGDFYTAIADAVDQAGAAKLLAITPASAYPTDGPKTQLAAAIQQYIHDTTVRASANFQDAPLV